MQKGRTAYLETKRAEVRPPATCGCFQRHPRHLNLSGVGMGKNCRQTKKQPVFHRATCEGARKASLNVARCFQPSDANEL